MWNISSPKNALNTFSTVWSPSGYCSVSWKDQTLDAPVHPPQPWEQLCGGCTGGCTSLEALLGAWSARHKIALWVLAPLVTSVTKLSVVWRGVLIIVRQTPWDSVKQHLWRCWSITSPGSEWQNYPVLWKQQPLFCVSHSFPPSCLPSPRAVLLMEAEAGELFVVELVCMKWVMLRSLSKALYTPRLLMPMYLVPGSSEVFLPPDPIFGTAMSEKENVLCAQLQCFHLPTLRRHGLHSWYAENCYEKSSFLCKRSKLGSVQCELCCVFKYAYNKYLEIVSLPFLIFAQWI